MNFCLIRCRYFYICGSSDGGWSYESNFTTAPDTKKEFTVAIYGDMGIENCQNTLDRLLDRSFNHEFDFIYHVGDLAYADVQYTKFYSTYSTIRTTLLSFKKLGTPLLVTSNQCQLLFHIWFFLVTMNT